MTKTQEKPTDAASSVDTFALIPLALLEEPAVTKEELSDDPINDVA